MRFIALMITAVLALPMKGCSDINLSDSTRYLVIDFFPATGENGTVFIDLSSRMVIVRGANLKTIEERPAPPGEEINGQQNEESNGSVKVEVLKLSVDQVNEIRQALTEFEEGDYDNQLNNDVLDGAAISIMHVNAENQFFKTDLVNQMTDNQRQLIDVVIKSLVVQSSKNKEYLNYFRANQ